MFICRFVMYFKWVFTATFVSADSFLVIGVPVRMWSCLFPDCIS